MRRPRGSLFWTIAGIFLLAVVVGTLVQVLVAVAVLRPLEAREARARAELAASGAAAELAAAPATLPIDTLLARHRNAFGPGPPVFLVYRARDGRVWTDRPIRSGALARFVGAPVTRDTFPDRPRHGPRWDRFEILARRPVLLAGVPAGEILVVRPEWPHGVTALPESRASLLFLPFAVLASVVAGLVMMRMLVRRLRALEVFAARVTEGDLSVRIQDPTGDEIGRLAGRLDHMAERLAEARAQLESTERQRRQLFADITHELATPLTSIRGYAETLLDPQVTVSTSERTRYVRGVLEEARRLDRLIRDLFELARLEAGATPLAKERLDWAALCRNTIERFEPRFRNAGLRLAWTPSLPEAWIEADGHHIEEVLDNLLVNALRYVPHGGTVELSLVRAPASAGRLRLTVGDDGPGIAPEDLPHVFERFYRGAGARDGGGSGLGLAIVREIVERHDGTVRARGRRPRGLSIEIELPAAG